MFTVVIITISAGYVIREGYKVWKIRQLDNQIRNCKFETREQMNNYALLVRQRTSLIK